MNHPDPNHKPYIHPNLPVMGVDETELIGWRKPSIGETIKTHWMAYVFQPKPMWRISAYWTSENVTHQGFTHYKVPKSIMSWLIVAWPLTKKLIRGVFYGKN